MKSKFNFLSIPFRLFGVFIFGGALYILTYDFIRNGISGGIIGLILHIGLSLGAFYLANRFLSTFYKQRFNYEFTDEGIIITDLYFFSSESIKYEDVRGYSNGNIVEWCEKKLSFILPKIEFSR